MAKDKGKGKAKDAEVPDEELDGAEGEVPAKKKPKLMMLVIAGVGALAILGGGGAGAYFMFLKPKPAGEHGEVKEKPKKKKKEGEHAGGKGEEGAPVVREGPDGVVFYTLPDIVVNMQTADGRPTFLKLKLTLELPNEEMAEELTPDMPRMNDMFQTFLREMRPEDLAGSQGSYQLRMEILRRVNLLVAPHKVNAVLIEEMLVN